MHAVELMYEALQPLFASCRSEDARRALENVLARFPTLAPAHHDLGMLYVNKGELEKGLAHLERAAEISPAEVIYLKDLAHVYYAGLSRPADALRRYEAVLEKNPWDVDALKIAANLQVSLQRFDAAARGFKRLVDIEPWNTEARDCLEKLERIQTGATAASPAEERHARACRLAAQGDVSAAIAELRTLLLARPDFALAHNDLGVLLYGQGDKENAARHYAEAVRIEPQNSGFLKNRADFLYVEEGRLEEALKLYLKVLENDPRDTEVLLTLGRVSSALGSPEEARGFLLRVLELDPGQPAAAEELGRLMPTPSGPSGASSQSDSARGSLPAVELQAASRSIASLELRVRESPRDAAAHNDLGVLCYQTGDMPRARELYERAVRLEPENRTFKKNLADFYFIEAGRLPEALKLYVSVLEQDPKDIEALIALGRICVGLGQGDDARVFYDRVLQVEPWNADAYAEIRKLDSLSRAA
jgi:tetratricopeptide (TPR) repeat protein